MSTYQYMLVQCGKCGKWFLMRGHAGKKVGVSLTDLASAESVIVGECATTHHKGRRRWQGVRNHPN